MACDIAKLHGASLHMISVEEIPNIPASIDEVIETKTEENHKFHDALAKARELAKKKGVKLDAKCRRHASGVSFVKAKSRLLVVGFMGIRRLNASSAHHRCRWRPARFWCEISAHAAITPSAEAQLIQQRHVAVALRGWAW